MFRAILITLTLISNICHASGIATSELINIVNESADIPSTQDLSEHIEKYKYTPWSPDDTFYSLITYTDDSYLPEMVAILSFHNEKLFSIITRAPINSTKIKSMKDAGANYIYYFSEKTELINLYEKKYLKGITFAG